jgi:hypothetical protein
VEFRRGRRRVEVGATFLTKGTLALLAVLAYCLAAQAPAAAALLVKPREPVAQGQVVLVALKGVADGCRIRGSWQGESLDFFPVADGEYASLVGVDLRLAPGAYPLEIRLEQPGKDPVIWRETLKVAKKDYGVEKLHLPEAMVTLDAPTLKRVREEGARFDALWGEQSPERYWRGPFITPVPGKLIAPFGRRRIINGEPRSPHTGADLRTALGEPVRAANNGRVVLVGEFFFHGNAVVIDHGWGLYTMYFHLSQVKVAQGDLVQQGTVIGLAGATGRASGPHLHWGVRLGGARIDPFALVKVTGG